MHRKGTVHCSKNTNIPDKRRVERYVKCNGSVNIIPVIFSRYSVLLKRVQPAGSNKFKEQIHVYEI